MNDLFEISKTYDYLYMNLKRPLTRDDFGIILDTEKSIHFLTEQNWIEFINDKHIHCVIKIKLLCSENIRLELNKIFPQWYDTYSGFRGLDIMFHPFEYKIRKDFKYNGCRTQEAKNKKKEEAISNLRKEMKEKQDIYIDRLVQGANEKIENVFKNVQSSFFKNVTNYLNKNIDYTAQNNLTPDIEILEKQVSVKIEELKKLKYEIQQKKDMVYNKKKDIILEKIDKAGKEFILGSAKITLINILKEMKREKHSLDIF